MRKVVLLGYMGSGKSVVGAELSRLSGLRFIDLDECIEATQKKTIAEIFASEGEIRFRKIEHETLKRLLDDESGFILSLGGGTPCYSNNHELIKKSHVTSFYLKANIETLCIRLSAEKDLRPLIQNVPDEELSEFIAKHLFDRSYFYNQADHVIPTDGKTIIEIAREIASKLT